jgi:hypothetical protein
VATLSKPVAASLAIMLAAAQAVQINIHGLSNDVSNVIGVVIVVIGALGVGPSMGAWIKTALPVHVAAVLGSSLAVLQALQQDSLHVGPSLHTVIAIAIVLLATAGIGATSEPVG